MIMKKHILLLFVALSFLSCSNDADTDTNAQLLGIWDWISSSGGIAGITETPESTGNTITLEISNSTVKRYVNGNLESELNYSIASGESIVFGEQREMVIYENEFKQTFGLAGNQLTLYDECNDCFVSQYERE